jgi:hypothetical protein
MFFFSVLTCIYITFFTCTYMYIHYLGHLPLPLQAEPVLPSCSLILLRENIKDNKKIMVFLLVWDRIAIQGDSLCCFHAHMYYNTNWFISTRPLHYCLVPGSSLRLLYSLLYSEHISHIQVFGFWYELADHFEQLFTKLWTSRAPCKY